jgi:predicted RNA-binding Zn-ribbon protein involved in translation (DUF1610 family)
MNKTCKHCGEPFIPREAKARFCCPECRTEWWQDERRAAMALLRRHRETEEEKRA